MKKHDHQVQHIEEVRFNSDDHDLPFRLDIYKLMVGEHEGRFVGIVSQIVQDTDIFDSSDDVIEQAEKIVAGKTLIHSVRDTLRKS